MWTLFRRLQIESAYQSNGFIIHLLQIFHPYKVGELILRWGQFIERLNVRTW